MAAEQNDALNEHVNEDSRHTERVDLVCLKCKTEFSKDRRAKLLHCLHTFCEACLQRHTDALRTETKDSKQEITDNKTDQTVKDVTDENHEALNKNKEEELTKNDKNDKEEKQTENHPNDKEAYSALSSSPSTSSPSVNPLERTEQESNKNNDSEVTSTDDGKLRCPECKQEYTETTVITNPFVNLSKKPELKAEEGSSAEKSKPVCTSCDENETASSFCMECDEWLCDPCVVAHKRVKLTKDHVVTNKLDPEELKDRCALDHRQRQMFCDVHKTEALKLFCLTCEALTCRDCQLNDHKDHNYKYIEQTIEEQKKVLTDGLQQLKDRLKSHQEMAEKIINKEKDIKSQQVAVFNEVRHVADMITNELISWCKKLLNFLQGVCHGRAKDLAFKKKEIDTFAAKSNHIIDFVESALSSGDDLALLYVKNFMIKNINQLKDEEINFTNTLLDLSITYENDANFLTKNVNKMGYIKVNGNVYPKKQDEPKPIAEPPKKSPLSGLTKDNFPQTISDLLGQEPPHVREKFKMLSTEKKRQFLHHLVVEHKKKEQQGNTALPSPNATMNNIGQSMPRNAQFPESQAIREMYAPQTLPPPNQAGRPGFVPMSQSYQHQQQQNSMFQHQQQLQRQQHIQMQQIQKQFGATRPGFIGNQFQQQSMASQQGNFQNWREASYTDSRHQLSPPTWARQGLGAQPLDTSSDLRGQSMSGVPSTLGVMAPKQPLVSSSNVIPASQLPPSGKYDFLDPLNLRGRSSDPVRVKEEPKDAFNPSCQYSKPTPPPQQPVQLGGGDREQKERSSKREAESIEKRKQVPTTSMTSPISSTLRSPAHTPSPSHSDGSVHVSRSSISPAVPDINVMDNDRNELLSGLIHPGGQQRISEFNLQRGHDPNDPSEDYCGVCHNGGDLLCCDRCPKVFHLPCHCPPINSNLSSSDVWTCTMCIPDSELIIVSPIAREMEITSTGKRKAPSGLVDKEIKVCERILLELFCMEISTCFHEPVPKLVPNYYKIINQPMDFGTIKCKLRRGHFAHYNNVEEFIADVKLVFRNCFTYNDPMSDVYAVGKKVNDLFEALVQHFLPCYAQELLRVPSPDDLGDPNGTGEGPSRNKKRRSPAPDSTRDNLSPLFQLAL
ncbi:transcription intermediary factor 1-alpha-like isoform X7 [Dreissena polymorpha]|uniref:transcription intermediary factor 1-alpha-like isoform X7 n=1 Tax=Dreissena polymorpha TaxID=45954 RepID=UPI0022645B6C|nr:transcription intermediary factor 1-alpha-like isoform X7 [Dreissena polymorpha]